MARSRKRNPQEDDISKAVSAVLGASDAVTDNEFDSFNESRARQRQYRKLISKAQNAEEKNLLEREYNREERNAERIRSRITKQFTRQIRSLERAVRDSLMLPGAPAHRSQISEVEDKIKRLKAKRKSKGFSDIRPDIEQLEAYVKTLIDNIDREPARPIDRRRKVKAGSATRVIHKPSKMKSGPLFSKRYLTWLRETEAKFYEDSKKFKTRPTRASFDALLDRWYGKAKSKGGEREGGFKGRLMREVPAFRHAFKSYERDDEYGVREIMRDTGLDADRARMMLRLVRESAYMDRNLDAVERKIARGEVIGKHTFDAIEKRLRTIFSMMLEADPAATPSSARKEIRALRKLISEAKKSGKLGSENTNKMMMRNIAIIESKYSGSDTSKWSRSDRAKIGEDIRGLRAMVEVAKKGPTRRRWQKKQKAAPVVRQRRALKPSENPSDPNSIRHSARFAKYNRAEKRLALELEGEGKGKRMIHTIILLNRGGSATASRPAVSNPKKASKKKSSRGKSTKKKSAKKKTQEYQRLINRCQKLWTSYCERPSKKRLEAVYVHLDRMKDSTSKKAKDERSRCLRAANKEAKRIKYKRK